MSANVSSIPQSHLLEAQQPQELRRVYVMPAPEDENDLLPFPTEGKGGKLIYMPARWSLVPVQPPRRQYRAHTVDWPRGYPAHDDL